MPRPTSAMPCGFAAALAVTAWATAAQVPAEASAHPSARFLIDRRGAGGASETAPASFVQALHSKKESRKKSPVKPQEQKPQELIDRMATHMHSKGEEALAKEKEQKTLEFIDHMATHMHSKGEEALAKERDAKVLRSLHPPMDHAKMSRGRPPPVEAVRCASVTGARVVSVADLHGDFVSMLQLLQGLGLVSRDVSEDPRTWQSMWAGGTAIFIQMGDILDRGSEGQRMWKFLWALQDEPSANVVLLFGNHEAWLFESAWEFNGGGPSLEDRCSYTTDPAKCLAHPGGSSPHLGHWWPKAVNMCVDPADPPDENVTATDCFRRAWSRDGFMGRQLLERLAKGQMKMAHAEAGTLFVHAGVTLGALDRLDRPDGECIDAMNQRAFDAISGRNGLSHTDFVITGVGDGDSGESHHGPTWTRRFATRDACDEVEEVVRRLEVDRMVKGHDPQFDGQAKSFCNRMLLLTDTYMSEGYTQNRGESEVHLMALEMSTEGTDIRFVYPMREEGQQCEALPVANPSLSNLDLDGFAAELEQARLLDNARPVDHDKTKDAGFDESFDEIAAQLEALKLTAKI